MISKLLELHGIIGTGGSKSKERQLLEEISDLSQIADIESRVKGHQAVFYDSFGKTSNNKSHGQVDLTSEVILDKELPGVDKQTMVVVKANEGFHIGQEVTIYDDRNYEDLIIKDLSVHEKTEFILTFVTPIQNKYKPGAVVCRSNVNIDSVGGRMSFGTWTDPKDKRTYPLLHSCVRYNLKPLYPANEVILWTKQLSINTNVSEVISM